MLQHKERREHRNKESIEAGEIGKIVDINDGKGIADVHTERSCRSEFAWINNNLPRALLAGRIYVETWASFIRPCFHVKTLKLGIGMGADQNSWAIPALCTGPLRAGRALVLAVPLHVFGFFEASNQKPHILSK
ncbi:MAG TPA: hypothetical protein DCL44_10320 [Elusimicrobia bacterium]|nr:hypothetical protein [Elusimicrobiota bacterium]